eukprot:gene6533-7508_t
MRFRAKMTNAGHVMTLGSICIDIVAAFQKASAFKRCCLRITTTKLHFTVDSESFEDDSRIWIEVIQGKLFESFVVQSMHSENEILLQLNLDHFCRALRSATHSHDLVMKLTKKDNFPFMTFKIGSVSSTGMTRSIVQDVPVVVRPTEEIETIRPPTLPVSDVNIYLPEVRLLRNIVDRMKSISHALTLQANLNGELILLVESDIVTVKTCFSRLENLPWGDNQGPNPGRLPHVFSSARINARKFAQFIGGAALGVSDTLLLSIGPEQVMLFVLHDDMTLTYMLPIMS